MNTPVSFEIAKLLKEKGIIFVTEIYYSSVTKVTSVSYAEIAAPTIAEVVMWLYEKHGIWIQPMIYRRNPDDFIGGIYYNKSETYFTDPFSTPTEAYEAGIFYTLNNLV